LRRRDVKSTATAVGIAVVAVTYTAIPNALYNLFEDRVFTSVGREFLSDPKGISTKLSNSVFMTEYVIYILL
jgi:hypothetical protein